MMTLDVCAQLATSLNRSAGFVSSTRIGEQGTGCRFAGRGLFRKESIVKQMGLIEYELTGLSIYQSEDG